jgi:UDP-3-O-[3-hydroxymyristoyl] glucosamine N-acyltransferase
MHTTLEDLAVLIGGRLVGDGAVAIVAAQPLERAGTGDITFIEEEKHLRWLLEGQASAALVGRSLAPLMEGASFPWVEVEDPLVAFLAVRAHLGAAARPRWTGIHPLAHVAESATIGEDVAVHPFACVGEGSELGPGCTIHPGAVVGPRCRLGAGVVLHAHVVLYEGTTLGDRAEVHAGTVLGGDGFGYRIRDGRHVKIPQTGTVAISADVEIGANCTIDRGTFGATTIGEGTKIDNLVMIGHNNQIGRHNLLCGQVGLAGSCRTGDYVVMAGQVGIKDHTEIGDRSMIGAQAGVHRDVPSGQQVLGSPALPVKEQRQLFALIARLPELNREIKGLKAEVARLKAALADTPGPEGTEGVAA